MRELHSRDGDRRDAPDAGADISVKRSHESPKLEVLRDPEVRIAKRLEYQKLVEARYAPEQLKPEPAKPENAPAETRDEPAGKIGERRESLADQANKRKTPERPRLPSNETAQLFVGVSIAASSVADAVNVLPGRWDAVATSALGAVAAGIAWGNKRWKDKHGHRPED